MKRLRLVLSCAFLLALAPRIGSSEELRDVKYSISIPDLKIPDGESVISIEINVTAGAFATFENIPVGWYVVIDNDASWQVSIKANTTVGAASLAPDEFKQLRFVIIKEKNPRGLEFGLSGVVGVTKDYEKETALPLKMDNFLLNDVK